MEKSSPNSNLQSSIKFLISTLLLLTICLIPNFLFGNLDSLEYRLTQVGETTEKVDLLNQLSLIYSYKDLDKLGQYANKALKLSETLNYEKGVANSYHNLSIRAYLAGNIEESKSFNQKAISIGEKANANDVLVRAYNILAANQNMDGKIDASIATYLKALKLAELENMTRGIIVILTNIGENYLLNENYTKARKYFLQGIEYGIKENYKEFLAWNYSKVAQICITKDSFEKAINYLDLATPLTKENGDKRTLLYIKKFRAEVHIKKNEITPALKNSKEAYQLSKEVGDVEAQLFTAKTLMEAYLKAGQAENAIKLGTNIQQFCKDSKVTKDRYAVDFRQLLSEAYAREGNYKKAYAINLDYLKIKDSINYQNRLTTALELEEKYQSERKETENALLRAKQLQQTSTIKNQKLINFSLSVIAFLVSLLGFVLYKAYQSKQKNNLLLEEKVNERTEELSSTNKELIQSNQELAKFAYVASHDLREPLRNITNFTGLLKMEVKQFNENEIKTYIDIIDNNAKQMNNLIISTLEYTRLSNKHANDEKVNLNQVVENISESISSILENRKASIQIASPLPTVEANPARMYSLFKNLIENGIKYNNNPHPEIIINVEKHGNSQVYSIADNGIGIDKKYHDTIFEMYKRLQSRAEYEGAGLGLANCKKIISSMGGEIWVESERNKGTIFYFSLS